jgi:type IV pilus assembly protein PilP
MRRTGAWLSVALILANLAACGSSSEELQTWMEQQKREVRPNVPPLKPPKKFDPDPYTVADAVDPFALQKLTVALKQEAHQPNSLMSAEMNRRREPLEAFPLDSMTMVGSVNRKGSSYALIKADGLLYRVKQGDYLGQNFGKVMKITETDIELREIVQDASGEWIERQTNLQLQENAK